MKVINLNIDEIQLKQLERLVAKGRFNRSEHIRRAIDLYLQSPKNWGSKYYDALTYPGDRTTIKKKGETP